MTVTVKNGQTLADIAIQEYGDLSAVFLLAEENDISPSDNLTAGTVLLLPDVVVNKEMQDYCKNNGVSPATEVTADSDIWLKIFTERFTKGYM